MTGLRGHVVVERDRFTLDLELVVEVEGDAGVLREAADEVDR